MAVKKKVTTKAAPKILQTQPLMATYEKEAVAAAATKGLLNGAVHRWHVIVPITNILPCRWRQLA